MRLEGSLDAFALPAIVPLAVLGPVPPEPR
jgi:hypothetical protein